MTLNGAIMQLVEMRENSMMPEVFKPYIDKVIETISECEEPSVQPDIIRCKDCKWYGRADKRRFYRGMDCLQKRIDTIVPDKDFCSKAERRTDE